VITALSTVSPRYASASAFSFWRIIAEISGGEYSLPSISTRASPLAPEITLYGTIDSSSRTSASLRPTKRLMEKMVRPGFVTGLALGHGADEPVVALRERDDGGGGAPALGVGDHRGLAALEDGHARVRRAQVDADRLAHGLLRFGTEEI
jgi:hypothetical protein